MCVQELALNGLIQTKEVGTHDNPADVLTKHVDKRTLLHHLHRVGVSTSTVDNGSSHIVFKLDTKAVVLVNRVVLIPTPTTIIDRINKMGDQRSNQKVPNLLLKQ